MTEPTTTATMNVCGRDITIKLPEGDQLVTLLLLFQREGRKLQAGEADPRSMLKTLERIDRVIRKLIVSEEDQDFIDDQIVDGNLAMQQLLEKTLATLIPEPTPEPEPAVAKPRAKRGRPPKQR